MIKIKEKCLLSIVILKTSKKSITSSTKEDKSSETAVKNFFLRESCVCVRNSHLENGVFSLPDSLYLAKSYPVANVNGGDKFSEAEGNETAVKGW